MLERWLGPLWVLEERFIGKGVFFPPRLSIDVSEEKERFRNLNANSHRLHYSILLLIADSPPPSQVTAPTVA